MDKVLDTVKKVLGVPLEDTFFDSDIVLHTNMALTTAFQLGATDAPFICDEETVWSDIMPECGLLSLMKTYIPAKVRTTFDPPTSSAVAEALKNSIAELEFRIVVQVGDGEVRI